MRWLIIVGGKSPFLNKIRGFKSGVMCYKYIFIVQVMIREDGFLEWFRNKVLSDSSNGFV